jgi:CarboxypepD_reg-like domain/Secretion system C-terminal sorting domain
MKKKSTAIQIQIPEPCTQDFSKMHPLPGGRFCDHCERTVVDFREMTDREIARIYQQRKGQVCGIFKGHQLDRPLSLPQPPKEGKPWAAIAALSSSLLFSTLAEGQTLKVQNEVETIINQPINANSISPLTLNEKVFIEGWVIGDKSEPIPFATILLANGNGTATNYDGYFKMEIPIQLIGSLIKVACMGYESKSVTIEKANVIDQPLEVELNFGLTLNEVVVVYNRNKLQQDWTGGGSMSMVTYGHVDNSIEIKVDNRIQITTYPNPFISILNVEMEVKTSQPYLFHLYNEGGQLVFAESRNLEAGLINFQLDLEQRHLPEGAYFLRISDDVGEVRTRRLVKVNP